MVKLAAPGVSLHSDIRRHEKAIAKHEEMMANYDLAIAEMDDKLNALIDFVDKTRRNGGTKR